MSLRSAHCETRALTARRPSHQLWSYAGLIVERYSSLSASVARSTASQVGAILNALYYRMTCKMPVPLGNAAERGTVPIGALTTGESRNHGVLPGSSN
jgi:hypothetical protein